MVAPLTYKDRLRRILYFFPLRLLVLHFKKNHLLLLCWLILFGYVFQFVSARYGIPYLVLAPEYFGQVGFVSFLITGLALGGFITAFNLYSYALHAFRFPFIATVARPFAKFSINNGVIPLLFIIAYINQSIDVQVNHELIGLGKALFNILGFIAGVAAFLLLSYFYFTRTNTTVVKLLGTNVPPPDAPVLEKRKKSKWFNVKTDDNSWHVETYLTKVYRIALARSTRHYKPETIKRVLWQHHINGSFFEILLIISFLGLGAFGGFKAFVIPAGASIFMLFTMVIMLIAALFSWLKGWTLSILFIAFVIVNQYSKNQGDLFYESHAVGLSYEDRSTPYNTDELKALNLDEKNYARDRSHMINTLNKWKTKNRTLSGTEKPKLVLIAVSGGGARSMLWTYRSLQVVDSMLGNTLMDRTALLTGSSGGLISAAYYRQLKYLDSKNGTERALTSAGLDDVSQDMLNPISYSLATNDLFIRFRKISDGDKRYTFDRGIAFEEEINENLHGILDIRMGDMSEAEMNAETPTLLISPTCINDGRSLLISSSPVSYLTHNSIRDELGYEHLPNSVEFSDLFQGNEPMNMKLTSALRMNATFPYIMPMVSLPTTPTMKIMDSGIRDNFGMEQTLNFMHEFKDWIAQHTGGVVILQVRDQHKGFMRRSNDGALLSRLFKPVGNVTGNMIRIQDMHHDAQLDHVSAWADFPVDLVPLTLQHDQGEEISLSWHLTEVEQERVLRQTYSSSNREQQSRLKHLLPTPEETLMGKRNTPEALPVDRN